MIPRTPFGCPRRDSSYPAARADGRIGWSLDLEWPEGDPPQFLYDCSDRVLVAARRHLAIVSSSPQNQRINVPGRVRWRGQKRYGFPLAIRPEEGAMHFVDDRRHLQIVDPDGLALAESEPVPGIQDEVDAETRRVVHFTPGPEGYVSVTRILAEEVDAPPRLHARGVRFHVPESAWHHEFLGSPILSPLSCGETLLVPLDGGGVASIDVHSGRELHPFALPAGEVFEWSSSESGVIYVLAAVDEQARLVALAPTGEELWSRRACKHLEEQAAPSFAPYPPCVGPEGVVFAFTEDRVFAFHRGNLEWWWPLEYEGTPRGAALADGSLIVSKGPLVTYFDPLGHLAFEISLPAEIVTPPIVDRLGRIYVATAERLVHIA